MQRIKELSFKRPDGQLVTLPIPQDLNQSLLRRMALHEYAVFPMATGRYVAEAEVATLKKNGSVVGFLIPGQAILSPDHPRNSDPLFGTYSLIAAITVCANSHEGIYSLASGTHERATSEVDVFLSGLFYAVIWIAKLGVAPGEFHRNYFVSFSKNGVYPSIKASRPRSSSRTLSSYDTVLTISPNKAHPIYIETILTQLSPYSENPFLRFFYLYQVIENLMASDYVSRFSPIRARFSSQSDISITQLKDYVDEFQGIVKEKPRIKSALQPECPSSRLSAEVILTSLGEDYSKLDFGECIYRIRNIIFHDYQRIHGMALEVSDLEDNLSAYILNQKLM